MGAESPPRSRRTADSQWLEVEMGRKRDGFCCQINAKSCIQYRSMSSDFADPILIMPSTMIKTMMNIMMSASSAAVGLIMSTPFTAFDN